MSSLGMLGLLEGVGKGVAKVGVTINQNALAEAEERRRMNMEAVRRKWQQEDAATARGWQQEDAKTERGWRQEDATTERGWRQEDMKTERDWRKEDTADDREWQLQRDAQNFDQAQRAQNSQNEWTLKNREPSEMDKNLTRAKKALEDGRITEEQFTQIELGIKTEAGMDAKDRADLKMKAYQQAREEIAGKDSLEGASPEKLKEIDRRASQIYTSILGNGPAGGGEGGDREPIDERVINEDARIYANLPEKAREAAKQTLKRKGYSDADLQLLEKKSGEAGQGKKGAANKGLLEDDGPPGVDLGIALGYGAKGIVKTAQATAVPFKAAASGVKKTYNVMTADTDPEQELRNRAIQPR